MNIKTLSLVSILLLGTVILSGCGSTNEENVWLANPASVYCEDNWIQMNDLFEFVDLMIDLIVKSGVIIEVNV